MSQRCATCGRVITKSTETVRTNMCVRCYAGAMVEARSLTQVRETPVRETPVKDFSAPEPQEQSVIPQFQPRGDYGFDIIPDAKLFGGFPWGDANVNPVG